MLINSMLQKAGSVFLTILVGAIAWIALDVSSRRKSDPNFTFLKCLLDAVCVIPKALRTGPWKHDFSFELAIREAKTITGLSDLGGEEVERDIAARYNTSISIGLKKSKIKLSPMGDYFLLKTNRSRMETRLRVYDFLKKHPDVNHIDVGNPIFVIGFPRTGTTFLHELLGLHEDVRMHYTWEQMYPLPSPGCADDKTSVAADRLIRYEKGKKELALILAIGGDAIQSIHRIGIDEPEECTTPCAMALPWNITTIAFITFACRELSIMGAGDAFDMYRSFLQIMTWQNPQDRVQNGFTWMLKCPFHLPYLTELHEAFPNATVVWTHRDPTECIASACSLYETLLSLLDEGKTLDKHALGAAVLEYTKSSLDKAQASISSAGSGFKVVHVRYADNVKNPKAVCKEVFQKASLPFSSLYESNVDAYLEKSRAQRLQMKEQKGNSTDELHNYSLEEYGLSEAKVRENFKDYIEKYALRESK